MLRPLRSALLALAVGAGLPALVPSAAGAVTRPICFPVVEPVSYTDDFGAPRSGGSRLHEGNDLMGARGYRLLAAASGVVVDVRGPGESTDHSVRIRGDDGWYYAYLHMNNDTQGTDDGLAPWDQIFAPGIIEGARVTAGQLLGYMGDSGNAESTAPHLHFELRQPAPTVWQAGAVSPYDSLQAATRCPIGGTPTTMGWDLRDGVGAGPNRVAFDFGTTAYTALAGDFDGDGHDSVGVWEPATAGFHLRNDLDAGRPDVSVAYGASSYTPVVGDWNGDGTDTIGVWEPQARTFHLRNSNDAGPPSVSATFGSVTWRPVVGDWDGDGDDTIGAYDPSTGTFHLRNSNTSGGDQLTVQLAGTNSAGEPVAGDWDGDGDDTPGLYTDGQWRLLASSGSGSSEVRATLGTIGQRPVVGDWNAGGNDDLGVVGRPVGNPVGRPTSWYLRDTNTAGPPDHGVVSGTSVGRAVPGAWTGTATGPGTWVAATGALVRRAGPGGVEEVVHAGRGGEPVVGRFSGAADELGRYADGRFFLPGTAGPIAYGLPGYVPLVGDWDGNGTDTIGVWVPANGTFYLRNTNTPGAPDLAVAYGTTGYVPVVGDWDGNGTDTIGVWVPANGTFHLRNTNTAGAPDLSIAYGIAGYVPVVGDWNADGTDTIGVVVP